jgi:hypothetical protein
MQVGMDNLILILPKNLAIYIQIRYDQDKNETTRQDK